MPIAIQPSSDRTRGAAAAASPLARSASSFTDTKRGENAVQNVVGGCRARNRINRPQCRIQIEQQHLMRDAERRGGGGLVERLARFFQKLLVAQTRDESAFLLQTPARSKRVDDRAPQLVDPFPGQ